MASDPVLTVDVIEAELQKPGYGVIRGWLAIHGGASARIVLEEVTQLVRALAPSSVSSDERRRLHDIVQRCNAVIDPERDPQLSADIDAVLTPCDDAGRCVGPLPTPSSTVEQLDALTEAALDVGIRQTVLTLRAAGFETTDSGDGISKPTDWFERGEAMPFPHVAASVKVPLLFSEARRMAAILGSEWVVEATYFPQTDSALLFASFEAIKASNGGT